MRALEIETVRVRRGILFRQQLRLSGSHRSRRIPGRARHGALKPGAKLVIETGVCAESILPTLVQKRWHRLGDLMILSENRYDAAAQPPRYRLHLRSTAMARVETRPASSYVFTVAEIGRMLETAGFEVLALYGSAAGEPFQLGMPRLLMIARQG